MLNKYSFAITRAKSELALTRVCARKNIRPMEINKAAIYDIAGNWKEAENEKGTRRVTVPRCQTTNRCRLTVCSTLP